MNWAISKGNEAKSKMKQPSDMPTPGCYSKMATIAKYDIGDEWNQGTCYCCYWRKNLLVLDTVSTGNYDTVIICIHRLFVTKQEWHI